MNLLQPIQNNNPLTTDLTAMPLEQAQTVATMWLNQDLERAFTSCTQETPVLRETWQFQEDLATAQQAGTATAEQLAMLQAMAIPGETLPVLSGKILAVSAKMKTVAANLIGLRRKALETIYAATTAQGQATTSADVKAAYAIFTSDVAGFMATQSVNI